MQEWILHLDEQTQFAVHIHQMIKLVLSIDDDDLSPLSERREGRERDVEDGGTRLKSENGTYMLNGNVDPVLARVDWFSFDILMEESQAPHFHGYLEEWRQDARLARVAEMGQEKLRDAGVLTVHDTIKFLRRRNSRESGFMRVSSLSS